MWSYLAFPTGVLLGRLRGCFAAAVVLHGTARRAAGSARVRQLTADAPLLVAAARVAMQVSVHAGAPPGARPPAERSARKWWCMCVVNRIDGAWMLRGAPVSAPPATRTCPSAPFPSSSFLVLLVLHVLLHHHLRVVQAVYAENLSPWLLAVLGRAIQPAEVLRSLETGVVLCELANAIDRAASKVLSHATSVPPPSSSASLSSSASVYVGAAAVDAARDIHGAGGEPAAGGG